MPLVGSAPIQGEMNPRRVNTLFKRHYPEIDLARCEWTHIMRDGEVRRDMLEQYLLTLETTNYLIHVHRKLGDFLPMPDAMKFIVENIGKGCIRITDRGFTRFVIVARNGVASTWQS